MDGYYSTAEDMVVNTYSGFWTAEECYEKCKIYSNCKEFLIGNSNGQAAGYGGCVLMSGGCQVDAL